MSVSPATKNNHIDLLNSFTRVIIRRNTDGKYLALWSSKWEENPRRSQQPDLPGGIIDPGETAEQGALREVYEETGLILRDNQLHLINVIGDLADDMGGEPWTRYLYTAEIDEAVPVQLSWEHERFAWLTVDELLQLDIRESYQAILRDLVTQKIIY